MRWIQWGLVLVLVFSPLMAFAEGENDPIWQGNTYERKIYAVGQRILQANHIQEKIAFRVTPANQAVNAYAMRYPGNVVVMERGLLRFIENDDELAFILGHEIAHIICRHHRKIITKRIGAAGVFSTLIVAAAAASPDFAEGFNKEPGFRLRNRNEQRRQFHLGPFEQKYETQADLVGIDYMVKAGYNPLNAENAMSKITTDTSWTGFWQTHPKGTKRINDIRHHIASRYPQFLSPELAKDWSQENTQLAGTTYFRSTDGVNLIAQGSPPNAPANTMPENTHAPKMDEATAVLSQLAQSGEIPSQPASTESALQASSQPAATPQQMVTAAATQTKPQKVESKPTITSVFQKPAPSASVAQVLLTLNADQLKIIKLLGEKEYLERQQLQETYLPSAPEEHLDVIISDLVRKKLLRVAGDPANEILLLTDWAAQELEINRQ